MSSYGGQKGPAWILLRKQLVRALWRQSDHAKIDIFFILCKVFQKKVEKGQQDADELEILSEFTKMSKLEKNASLAKAPSFVY